MVLTVGPEFTMNESANVVYEVPQPMALTVSTDYNKDEWVLDSGCTFHITPDKNWLFDLKDFKGNKVLMANNTLSEVKGMEKIKIVNPDGSVVILTDVRYVPQMGKNLMSYGMLDRSGCKYEGENGIVHFYKAGKEVFTGK